MAHATTSFEPFGPIPEIPHDEFRRVRAESPVARCPGGAWFLATQADVVTATKAVDVFVGSSREPGVVVPDEEKLISEIEEPRHGQMRRVINSAIAFHKVRLVEDFVRGLAGELLDPILERGEGDLIAEFCLPIPSTVIAHLVGVPAADFRQFTAWADEVVHSTYATKHRTARGEGIAGGFPEFAAYVDDHIAARLRAADPPDDLITRLCRTEIDGVRLTPVEVRSQIVNLIIAGNETTRHLIGSLVHRVARDRWLFEALERDPSLVDAAVEETLRLDSPVHMLLRDVVADTDRIPGCPMRAGDKVVFGLASANRDESVYDAPDEFRLDRPRPKDHVAFGDGPHVCPGASLARLEARAAVQVLVARTRAIRLAPGFTFTKVPVFWANGPHTVHAVLEAR